MKSNFSFKKPACIRQVFENLPVCLLNLTLNHNLNLRYRLKQIDNNGTFTYSEEIEVNVKFIPTEFSLEQNYPNPFNPVTNFEFRIPNFGFVGIKIYDILGNEVTILVNEEKEPGYYTIRWNADKLASGVYFYMMHAKANDGGKDFRAVKKMLVLK